MLMSVKGRIPTLSNAAAPNRFLCTTFTRGWYAPIANAIVVKMASGGEVLLALS